MLTYRIEHNPNAATAERRAEIFANPGFGKYFTDHMLSITWTAADDARARAFEVTVKEPLPQYPGQWSLTCERRDVVLDTDTIRGNSDYFDDLAARFGGEYDGWEASVR